MDKSYIMIEKPKHPVVRYSFVDDRHIYLDLRGIRCPKGNLNGRPNPSKGHKRRFLTPEHLKCMVDEYFESCNGPSLDKNGYPIYGRDGNLVKTQVRPYTVSGLALYLGIKTDTMRRYTTGKIDSLLDEMMVDIEPNHLTYAKIILDAKQRIEAYAEGRLYDVNGQRGAQFVLDNIYKWTTSKEQAEIEHIRAETRRKDAELELKKKLLGNEEGDSNITINIVRGRKDDE